MQTPAKAPELFKSDVLASIAARDKVFVLRQKMLAQGKTPARAGVGLRSAAKSVLPKAAKSCPIKMLRYARYNESESEPDPADHAEVSRNVARILWTRSSGSFSTPDASGRSTLSLISNLVRS